MYKLIIRAVWYDSKGNLHTRENELPISEATALSLKQDAQGQPCCPISSKGDKSGDVEVEILKDGEMFGGWCHM